MGLFHPQTLTVEAGRVPLLVSAGDRQFVLDDGQQFALFRAGSRIRLRNGDIHIVVNQLKVVGRNSDAEIVVAVPGKLRRAYRGTLTVLADGGELLPIVEMDLETAVASVLAAELPADTPLEALKAQAVVSRSYLAAGGPRHRHADFCDTTHCEFLRNPPPASSAAARATAATRDLVLAWQGKPFAAMYSASCGGRTRSLGDVGYRARDYPFFAVECPYCRRGPQRWASTLTPRDAATLDGTDRARVQLGRERGWNAVPSNTFSAKAEGDAVTLMGVGRGHGVGLCQRAAAGMAREGHNFREILAYYFPNTTLQSLP
jgi:stage II sporulation protein D